MALFNCIVQSCISMLPFTVNVSSLTQYQLNLINVATCCSNVNGLISK